uniref:Uncharacterized protein n=1 Tax=Sphaerodactylus townsendi TaxID=933632 RepID=A0ACB8F1W6_9SAUR
MHVFPPASRKVSSRAILSRLAQPFAETAGGLPRSPPSRTTRESEILKAHRAQKSLDFDDPYEDGDSKPEPEPGGSPGKGAAAGSGFEGEVWLSGNTALSKWTPPISTGAKLSLPLLREGTGAAAGSGRLLAAGMEHPQEQEG